MEGIQKSFTFDGKRYWVRGKTEAEAIEKMVIRKKELEHGLYLRSPNVTVNEWFDEFMGTYKKGITEKTRKDYISQYKNCIKPYIGLMQIKAVRQIDCQKIINNTSGKSKSYVSKVYILLNSMFETAKDNAMIRINPAKKIAIPDAKSGSRRPLTQEERKVFTEAYLNASKGGLFCAVIYYCGLRPSEVARIQGGDYKDGVLHVRGTKTKAATRDVPIPSMLILPNIKKGELLFCSQRGTPLDKSTYQHYWDRVKREMNIVMGAKVYRNKLEENLLADDLTMYCLRHDYCTRLEEAGVPINVARRLMGHSDISVTAKIYTHDSKTAFDNAHDLIEKYNSATVCHTVCHGE